jgi:hypothetical protein
MSDFVYLFRNDPVSAQETMGTPERAQQSMQRWLSWIRELEASGNLKQRGQPLERTGKVVRGKTKMVIDGPFTEAKDIVSGFIIVQARDAAHAAELAKGCPILDGDGTVEVRPVMEMNF